MTRWQRPIFVFLHDVFVASLCLPIALVLTQGTPGTASPFGAPSALIPTVAIYILVMSIAFTAFDMYRGVWRYASLRDLRAILLAVSSGLALFALIGMIATLPVAMGWRTLAVVLLVQVVALAGPRYLYRYFRSRSKRHLLRGLGIDAQRVVVIGYGNQAESLIRDANADLSLGLDVVGVVDLGGRSDGARIHDVPIVAVPDDTNAATVYRTALQRVGPIDAVVLAEDTTLIDGGRAAELFRVARQRGIRVSKLANSSKVAIGSETRFGASHERLAQLAYEDLLRRPGAQLDRSGAQRLILGRRVLITGAGGTIGAELSRQIADLGPSALCLVDQGEFALYTIDRHVRAAAPELSINSVLGDITDALIVDRIVSEFRPDVVFHAAALKHVPLVENNPVEGIKTNLLGTRVVAEACVAHAASVMINISTDKAVAPSSIMGATKRAAETLIRSMDLEHGAAGCRFVSVRFGNVLGSTGSVVPLFQEQIRNGGPVTVTDPQMTRYLMTVNEAVSLVLAGSGLCPSGNLPLGTVLVLDMGEPRRILDIAHDLIGMAGLVPNADIAIRFIGARPGEKLHEALIDEDETINPADVALVNAIAAPPPNPVRLMRSLDEVTDATSANDPGRSLAALARFVPAYRPDQVTRDSGPSRRDSDGQPAAGAAE